MNLDKLKENKKTVGIISILIILIIMTGIYLNGGKEKVVNGNSIFQEEDKGNSKETTKKGGNVSKESVKKEEEISKENTEITVDIKGEVKNPGVYTLDEGSIVEDLIIKAGGITKDGSLKNINRAKLLTSNEAILIPNKKDDNLELEVNDKEGSQKPSINNEKNNKKSNLININTASLEELKNITGIGDSKAAAIIKYREENGGFKSIDEIKNISGIGDKTFEKMKDSICI